MSEPEPPIVIFYHICAIQHCMAVVEEQMNALLYSGLYADPRLTDIHCFITANNPHDVSFIKYRLLQYGAKIRISGESLDTKTYERFTLEKIKPSPLPENARILYIHTKGVSQTEPDKITNTTLWTRALNYHLIGRYRECLDALNRYDVVGAFYAETPLPHFQGNFWWSRMSYIKTLPDRIGPGYLEPELNFLFTASPTWFNMARVPSAIQDLYKDPLYPMHYVDGVVDMEIASCK